MDWRELVVMLYLKETVGMVYSGGRLHPRIHLHTIVKNLV